VSIEKGELVPFKFIALKKQYAVLISDLLKDEATNNWNLRDKRTSYVGVCNNNKLKTKFKSIPFVQKGIFK
jgi:hypothetical protein